MIRKRVDGVQVKDELDSLHVLFPYVMTNRTDAEVCLKSEIDITELFDWTKKKSEETGMKITIFHAVCAAMGKTVIHRPLLNRFISAKRYWQRNDITLSFVAKREFSDGAAESLLTFSVKEDQNIFDLSRFVIGDVTKLRKSGGNSMDNTMGILAAMPRWMLNMVFAVVGWLEYHGIVFESLIKGDSNYSTVMLSNLGSIGGGSPYHHLNNYGTNSIMVIVGSYIRKKNEAGEERLYLPLSITVDERISDGFYFIRSFKYTEWLLNHPEELERPFGELGDYSF